MKNIFVIFFISILFVSCKSENKTEENQNEQNQNVEQTQTTETTTSPVETEQDNNAFDVSVYSREAVDMYGSIALENEEGILFYINERNKKGEIAIGNDPYLITEVKNDDGVYTFKGEGIEITTTKCKYQEAEADCFYGTFETVTIKFKNQVKTFKNIKLQDCSSLGM